MGAGWLVSGTMGVDMGGGATGWGGDEGRCCVDDGECAVKGTSGISVSLAEATESLSDDGLLSLSLSDSPSMFATCGVEACEGEADVSESSSSASEPSGVGEWLRKRAGRRASAGDDRVDTTGLTDRAWLSSSRASPALDIVSLLPFDDCWEGDALRAFASWLLKGSFETPFVASMFPKSQEFEFQGVLL